MKNTKISRRSFLLGLAACSAAGVLTACSGSSEPASSASTAPEPPASSAASEVTAAPFLTVEDFPALDGSTHSRVISVHTFAMKSTTSANEVLRTELISSCV